MNITLFVQSLLENPIFSFLAAAGLIAYIIRDIFTTVRLRIAAKSVASFIDEYAKYDKKGAEALDRALIEYHRIALEEMQNNKTGSE